MSSLSKFYTPQLEVLHRGKVRDSIRINDTTRMIVVTDRISAFNLKIETPVPHKGAVLNGIANHWFSITKHIIDNHVVEQVDPSITLVKEAEPIRVEMVVRGYLTGSMWRGYKDGQRTFSGATVPDGLTQNQRFDEPVITPTTKDEDDTPIDEAGIIETGLVSAEMFQEMKTKAIELFKFGTQYLEERGIVLVDTKYEFGILDGKLIIIDEMHTPDSSRFWGLEDYKKSAIDVEQIDKEFVRQWMLANKVDGQVPTVLAPDVVAETARRYQEIYEVITGNKFVVDTVPVEVRMYHNLVKSGVLKPGYVAVLGEGDDAQEVLALLENYGIAVDQVPSSALVPAFANIINYALESVVVLAREGQEDFIAELCVPVINVTGGNSLQVADAALRSLNIRALRSRMATEQA